MGDDTPIYNFSQILELGSQHDYQPVEITQKDLATRINEKPQVIADYEQARAIPNQQVLSKLERTLGIKLRGKDKGKPFEPRNAGKN